MTNELGDRVLIIDSEDLYYNEIGIVSDFDWMEIKISFFDNKEYNWYNYDQIKFLVE